MLGIPTLTRFLKKIDRSLTSPASVYPAATTSFSSPLEGFGRPRDKVLGGGYVFPTQAALTPEEFRQGIAGPSQQQPLQSFSVAACLSGKREAASQSASPEISRPSAPIPKPPSFRQTFDRRTPPSRCHSRSTMVSVGSFSLNHPIASPLPMRDHPDKSPHPSRVVSSVLESFDPSFLTNLPANQIDDLENALLPHLNQEVNGQTESENAREQQPASGTSAVTFQSRSTFRSDEDPLRVAESIPAPVQSQSPSLRSPQQVTRTEAIHVVCPANVTETSNDSLASPMAGVRPATQRDIENSIKASKAGPSKVPAQAAAEVPFTPLTPSTANARENVATAKPVVLKPKDLPAANQGDEIEDDNHNEADNDGDDQDEEAATYTMNVSKNSSASEVEYDEDLVIDESGPQQQASTDRGKKAAAAKESTEISVNLETVKGGQSFKFAIPGSSKYVALNFSADALLEMKNSVKKTGDSNRRPEDSCDNEVSSSTEGEVAQAQAPPPVTTKPTSSRLWKKKRAKDANSKGIHACSQCAKVYPTKILLDKHLAFHLTANVSCRECGKVFLR